MRARPRFAVFTKPRFTSFSRRTIPSCALRNSVVRASLPSLTTTTRQSSPGIADSEETASATVFADLAAPLGAGIVGEGVLDERVAPAPGLPVEAQDVEAAGPVVPAAGGEVQRGRPGEPA